MATGDECEAMFASPEWKVREAALRLGVTRSNFAAALRGCQMAGITEAEMAEVVGLPTSDIRQMLYRWGLHDAGPAPTLVRRRWRSVSVVRAKSGWVWSDRAGWGEGVFRSRLTALLAALRGKS